MKFYHQVIGDRLQAALETQLLDAVGQDNRDALRRCLRIYATIDKVSIAVSLALLDSACGSAFETVKYIYAEQFLLMFMRTDLWISVNNSSSFHVALVAF
jgi:hypothetical protein